MFHFCISILGWHLTANPAVSAVQEDVLSPPSTGHPPSAAVGEFLAAWALACPFTSVTIPDDCRALNVFSYVILSGICSIKGGWNSSYWHLLWTKGGESKHLVFWVAGRFSEGFPELCFKTKFVFCFRFFNIFPSKKRRRSVALKATSRKSGYSTYGNKMLSTCWTKTGKCSWIVTKCDDSDVTGRLLSKNMQIIRQRDRNQLLEIRCPL